MEKLHQLWSVRVVLHGEDRVQLWADLDGSPIRSAPGEELPIQEALTQLEAALSATEGADISLAIRTGSGPWLHVATRRWRIAVYLVLTHYERAFVALQSARKDSAEPASNAHGPPADERDEQLSPPAESGVVCTDSTLIEALRSEKGPQK